MLRTNRNGSERHRRKERERNRRSLRFESLEAKRLLAAEVIFADSFEQGSNPNDWNGAWVEYGSGSDWLRSTATASDGNFSAELDYTGTTGMAYLELAQPIDLINYTDVTLDFSWSIDKQARRRDYANVQMFDGANWNTIYTFRGDVDPEGVWNDFTLNVNASYLVSDFSIRFAGETSGNAADFNIDNLRISGVSLSPATPTISVADATVTEGDSEVTPLITVASPGNGGWSLRPSPDYDADGFADHYVSVRLRTNNILWFDAQNASEPEVFIPEGRGGMVEPRFARFGPDGHLYVTDYATDKILRFDGLTGNPLGIDPANPDDATFVNETATDFSAFGDGLVFDAEDNLLVSVYAQNGTQVAKYQGPFGANPGQFLDFHIPSEIGQFENASGLEFDSEGNLYVTDLGLSNEGFLSSVKRFDASGLPHPDNQSGPDLILKGTAGLAGARNLRIADPDGTGLDLFVPSENGILRFDGSTGEFEETYIAPIARAYDIEFLEDGTSLVAMPFFPGDADHGDIERFGPSSTAVFTISLSAATVEPVTVDVSTVNGTATNGSDFQSVSTSLVFQPGETTKNVLVPTINDATPEPLESYSVELTNIVGADPGDLSGTAWVVDDDTPNSDPVAVDDSATAQSDIAQVIDVLANDSDPDGDTLVIISCDSVSLNGGTVVINPDQTLSYTSASGFTGQDSFSYSISDGQGDPVTATVTVDVSETSSTKVFVNAISFQSRRGGKEWRAIYEVYDEFGAPVAGATITVTFAGESYAGNTDANGQFRSGWLRLSSGTYEAEVTDVVFSNYTWDLALGWGEESDDPDDLYPDALLTF